MRPWTHSLSCTAHGVLRSVRACARSPGSNPIPWPRECGPLTPKGVTATADNNNQRRLRFDRSEAGGALGDLGTFIPLLVGMVHQCGLQIGPALLCGGAHGNVLRIKPPMCITRDDVDFLADTLDEVFASLE